MFEDSLVESFHRIKPQSRWTVLISVGVQAAVAAAILAVPLLRPEALNRLNLLAPQLVAPIAPLRPPPVRVIVHAEPTSSAPSAPAPMLLDRSTEHSPADRLLRPSDNEAPPSDVAVSIPGGMSNGSPTGTNPFGNAPSTPAVHVTPSKPLTISSGVSAGMLLAPIRPVYPPIARAAHVEGTVVIHAIISKSGVIERATVVSGPPMLQVAAMDAVRTANYRPFQLNGQPTEVETTINIVFHLGG